MTSHFLTNGQIYTLGDDRLPASSVFIEKGKIVSLDLNHEQLTGIQDLVTINLEGRTVLPGLTDSHLHLRKYALNLQRLNCETPTKAECLHLVKEKADQTPDGEWILGHGWNHNIWPAGSGTAQELDQAAPHNPVYLTSKSLHSSWANSLALEKAHIHQQTPDPPGGTIGRGQLGQPIGLLYETASKLIEDILPEPDLKQTSAALLEAQEQLWKMGLTGVHDFDRRRCFSALQQLHQEGKLGLRVLKSLPIESLEQAVELGLRTGLGDDLLWIGGVKAFADGALGPQTAAMLSPYRGQQDQLGMLLMSLEELTEKSLSAAENGLSMAIHAIGDRAVRLVLDCLETVRNWEKAHQDTFLPHRIEHVQIISPEDKQRLAELDIIASMQPIHAVSDMEMADRYWGDRAVLAYAPRTQLTAGARVIFGSDAPVESPNPFWGIHAAVTRQNLAGEPRPDGWYPQERVSVQESLRAYTVEPAAAGGKGSVLGKLLPGYYADLIVLDEDPYRIPAPALADVKPVGTMLAGDWVFRDF